MNSNVIRSPLDSGPIEEFDRLQTVPLFEQSRYGVELVEVDLKRVSRREVINVRQLLAKHGLILIRNQALHDSDLINFSRLFGSGMIEPSARRISHGHTERHVAYLTNLLHPDGSPFGFAGDTTDFWHSDQEFREKPASIGVLYCLIQSEAGGATSFATTAVRNLNISKAKLSRLRGLSSTRQPASTHDNAPQWIVSHPVVVANSLGEEFVYVSENALDFQGCSSAVGEMIKDALLAEILKPENIYSHDWKMGDLILYDNIQLLHRREEFQGVRLMKAIKIYPDGKHLIAPLGRVVSHSISDMDGIQNY
ncbi:Taurine catabolism dioxygenase TauD/TfdA [Candidatus Paraburkholderia kirkii UZHbot1]|uniref:Taurine catabolism dioxygenase TauD/TfdA n=1 Tax=Candidatus Paraburkholderia kirkii UZHbot1 TaxID=1055526 RepID=G4ME04_9BURK|nr:Taurine catabolism dioxygenase TauD/TfdA [Candidatus Paraburkholderia kirkii UZHbot1]